MKKILVVGSINIDLVFSVKAMVRKGETIHSSRMDQYLGGKGFNQAIALRRAYPDVSLAVNYAQQDGHLKTAAEKFGLNTSHMLAMDEPTGMAFIQVDEAGDNCIVLNAGANGVFTRERFASILKDFSAGDLLVLQNEINQLDVLIELAKAQGLLVALNPSPFDEKILKLPLDQLDYLVLNEIEGAQLCSTHDPKAILTQLSQRFAQTCVVLTLGGDGAMAQSGAEFVHQAALKIDVVDTTAAGDTFLGFFCGAMQEGQTLAYALKRANAAAALCCTRAGASSSIPTQADVDSFLNQSA